MDTISKIYDALENFDMRFSIGFTQEGNPTVGLRSVKDVIIDGIPLIVAGDVYCDIPDTCPRTRMKLITVNDILNQKDISTMTVDVRVQGYVRDLFVLELGKWKVVKREEEHGEYGGGILRLQKMYT